MKVKKHLSPQSTASGSWLPNKMSAYRAEIITTEDVDLLHKSLITEKAQTPRASLDIKKHDNKLIITVEAKDSTALRAMLNGVCKLLNVYEKTK